MPTLCKKKHLGISYKAKKQALLSSTITQNVERNVTFVTSSSKKRLWQAPFCDFLRKAMFAKPLEEFQVRTHKLFKDMRVHCQVFKLAASLQMELLKSLRNKKDLNDVTVALFLMFFLLLVAEKKTPNTGQL